MSYRSSCRLYHFYDTIEFDKTSKHIVRFTLLNFPVSRKYIKTLEMYILGNCIILSHKKSCLNFLCFLKIILEKNLTGDSYSSKLSVVASINIKELVKIYTASFSWTSFMECLGLQVLTNYILVAIHVFLRT